MLDCRCALWRGVKRPLWGPEPVPSAFPPAAETAAAAPTSDDDTAEANDTIDPGWSRYGHYHVFK